MYLPPDPKINFAIHSSCLKVIAINIDSSGVVTP